jgi:hypothetical protein
MLDSDYGPHFESLWNISAVSIFSFQEAFNYPDSFENQN